MTAPLSSAAKSALRRFLDPQTGELKRMRRAVFDELTTAGFPVQCELGPIIGGYGAGRVYYPLLRHEPHEPGYGDEWKDWCERARAALVVP